MTYGGFFLEGREGNNAFAFEQRGERPKLWVPALMEGTWEDLELGEESVFEDEDEHGELKRCTGLKQLLRTSWQGVPTFVMDNHNHAFAFWMQALSEGLLQKGATLIHVDQHKDMRRPETLHQGGSVEDYTNRILNVGNYIVPAVEHGLVKDIVFVTGETDLDQVQGLGEGNKILNIDLDYFAPELSYIDFEKAKAFIHEHLKTASVVTIATSPFFIDQELALQRMRELF